MAMFIPENAASQISPQARWVAQPLAQLSLSSTADLAAVLRCKPQQVYPGLADLTADGFVDSVRLGSPMRNARPGQRWFFTPKGVESVLGPTPGPTWHEEGNRCRLLEIYPSLAWFYHVIGTIRSLGPLREFLWLEGWPLEAAARFDIGWVGLCWSAMLETEDQIMDRLQRLGPALQEDKASAEVPWPGQIVFLVTDRWQGELVRRAVRRYGLNEFVAIWCVADGHRTGAAEPLDSRGWLRQPVRSRGVGHYSWEARVRDSIWSQPDAPALWRMARTMYEFPGMTTELAQASLANRKNRKIAERLCRDLTKMGSVQVLSDEKDGRVNRFTLSPPEIDTMVRQDRTTVTNYERRVMGQSWVLKQDRRDHEEGVMRVLGAFMAASRPVAAGFRAYQSMGNRGAVSPDGVVDLTKSPLGSGWHYLEYELQARGPKRIGRKLRGYASPARRHRMPLLVVCWNKSAEENFWQVGQEANIEMLTTTVRRLEKYGPMDNFSCWRVYGNPVRIA